MPDLNPVLYAGPLSVRVLSLVRDTVMLNRLEASRESKARVENICLLLKYCDSSSGCSQWEVQGSYW